MAFSEVNESNVYLCAGSPSPSLITSMMNALMTDSFNDALMSMISLFFHWFIEITEMKSANQFALQDILPLISTRIQAMDLSSEAKIYIYKQLADLEYLLYSIVVITLDIVCPFLAKKRFKLVLLLAFLFKLNNICNYDKSRFVSSLFCLFIHNFIGLLFLFFLLLSRGSSRSSFLSFLLTTSFNSHFMLDFTYEFDVPIRSLYILISFASFFGFLPLLQDIRWNQRLR